MGYTDAPPGWWQDFVGALPARTAKLAVTRKDGSPHVAPVWVDIDGDDIVFMTSAETVKGRSILRDGSGGAVLRRRGAAVLLRDALGNHRRRRRIPPS